MSNNTDKVTNHGGSSILLFNYLNSLAVLGTNQEHVEMIVKILNSIPGTMIMAAHSGKQWFITYSYFGYYSIGPGASELK